MVLRARGVPSSGPSPSPSLSPKSIWCLRLDGSAGALTSCKCGAKRRGEALRMRARGTDGEEITRCLDLERRRLCSDSGSAFVEDEGNSKGSCTEGLRCDIATDPLRVEAALEAGVVRSPDVFRVLQRDQSPLRQDSNVRIPPALACWMIVCSLVPRVYPMKMKAQIRRQSCKKPRRFSSAT